MNNINWIQTFEILIEELNAVQMNSYLNPLKKSGMLNKISEEEVNNLVLLLKSVFTLGDPDNVPERYPGAYNVFSAIELMHESLDENFKLHAKKYFTVKNGIEYFKSILYSKIYAA